ncbi:MAG TPA: SDR family oxidoreductase [Propionibacteriaceae bacterium]|nr:SDR family oxidoreductase [Propionibacteriaceae bacterium]
MSRIAVVTGAGTGIGSGAATALAAEGWLVVLAGRRPAPLQELAAAHPDLLLDPVPTDVSDEDSVRNLFDVTMTRHGRVDLLFNNAGMGGPPRELDEIRLNEWQAVVNVNLTGAFLCTREAFRIMRRQQPQGGRIINNGSIAAHTPRPRSIAYAATKHAITGLTKSTALDGRHYGIACGQIDPGNTGTAMTAGLSEGVLQADGSIQAEPWMNVADVARAVVYMASLPLDSNVAAITVMPTKMPFVGRG